MLMWNKISTFAPKCTKTAETMKTRITIIAVLLMVMTATTALARVPRKQPTALDKGMMAYDKEQYEEAIRWMDEALAQNADNGIALAYKGASLRLLDRMAEAEPVLARAAQLIDDTNSTTRAWVHHERFYALVSLGDTVQAMREIDLAIADNDRKAQYFRNRGVIHSERGNLEEAIADYDRAIALDPSDEQVKAMRDETAQYLEKYNQATAGGAVVVVTEREVTEKDGLVKPQFPGGMDALREHIYKKTGWTSAKAPVSVMVEVTIDKTGRVTNAVVSKGVEPKLDKKALDICRKLPNFVPATFEGKPVETTMTIPVRFPKPKK